jgi:hypothetical protein
MGVPLAIPTLEDGILKARVIDSGMLNRDDAGDAPKLGSILLVITPSVGIGQG